VRVGQPGVEREHRYFDGEGEEETQKEQCRDTRAVVGINARRGVVESLQSECVSAGHVLMVEVKEQDAEQHQHGTGQRVEEEFDGGVELAGTSPDTDQQVHGHEHGFPENEEEEKIERHEDAEHAGLQHQKPDVVFLDAILDGGPGGKDRDPAQQRGEHDEQERDAVNAEHVASADGWDPVAGRAFDELEAGLETLRPEPGDERQRDQKTGEREKVRNPADSVFVLLGNEKKNERAHERREEDDG
jgi:hypothetical protein